MGSRLDPGLPAAAQVSGEAVATIGVILLYPIARVIASHPLRRRVKLRMDMDASSDGNDEMLSVYPRKRKEDSGKQEDLELSNSIQSLIEKNVFCI